MSWAMRARALLRRHGLSEKKPQIIGLPRQRLFGLGQLTRARGHVAFQFVFGARQFFVELGVANGDSHLRGIGEQQPFVLIVVDAGTIGHADHADRGAAQP